ncbi:MAG: phosphoglucomutase (alpha-D-glucose-1,6-bisphosphate-dependent) [Gemmatimonadales bacterium]
MNVNPRAGQPANAADLTDVPRLMAAYYVRHPDLANRAEQVSFGTSGHRGSSLDTAFNEDHILAITQAICDYRAANGIDGPLFLGIDTHALSASAYASALEVLAANNVTVMLDEHDGYTPTPVVSHAILVWNRGRKQTLADGIVITPSHNPPHDGGFKYDPTNGGGAAADVTRWIQDRANRLLGDQLRGVRRVPFERACRAATTRRHPYLTSYVADLENVIDLKLVAASGLRFAVDPLGGAGVKYWDAIAERYGLPLTVLNRDVDPTFRFMTLDWDGQIRMDPSSRYAMAPVIARKDQFDVTWACDTDHDRHGIVTPDTGLLDPNAYLAVAIDYLAGHRPEWPANAAIGKTVVSSSMIDRVTARTGRRLFEVPVGFKWFADGLCDGSLAFAGEESAGATLARRNGEVWTTDKDGIVLGLLAAEITTVTKHDPGERYRKVTAEFGECSYARVDAPATPEQQAALGRLAGNEVTAATLAGDPITGKLTRAPGNDAPIGGLKVITANGWFAARPSGTEPIYKLYAESFKGPDHLHRIQEEAQAIINDVIGGAKH